MTQDKTQDGMKVIIARPAAELSLKGDRARNRFMQLLRNNIIDGYEKQGIEAGVYIRHRRIFIETAEQDRAAAMLGRVFGVGTFSPVRLIVPAEMDAIVNEGGAYFADVVKGRRFQVRTKKYSSCDFGRTDVNIALGAALNGHGKVDLTDPEITVAVELLGDEAYLYVDRIKGQEGLPLGTQGRALALISGGYDSAVAAWQVMKRGVETDFLFCNLGGGTHERMVVETVRQLAELWAHGKNPKLYIIDFAEPVKALKDTVQRPYWQLVLKRLMFYAASHVGREMEADALVTGECIGQVSSQTLKNLGAIEDASAFPVLRPVVTLEKTEIMQQAEYIGTAAIAQKMKEYCDLAGGRPVTGASPGKSRQAEKDYDYAALDREIEAMRVLDIRTVTDRELRTACLYAGDFPEDAVFIDCQPRAMYDAWHVDGALHMLPENVAGAVKKLDKAPTYVLYCPWGTQTPHLAEMMQKQGFDAYAFEGGVKQLKAALEKSEEPRQSCAI